MGIERRYLAALVSGLLLVLLGATGCGRGATDRAGGRTVIRNRGSDSMVIVALVWAAVAYQRFFVVGGSALQ